MQTSEAKEGGHGSAPPSMWLSLFRVSLLIALAASAALYLQYLNPAQATFCGLESGCEAVRRAGFSYFFESPLLSIPLVGLVAYATVLASSLWQEDSRTPLILSAVGAALAVALLLAQAFLIHAFCWLCATVDGAAIAAPVFAYLHFRTRSGGASSGDPLRTRTWIALAGLSIAAPTLWVKVKPAPPVPDVIQALYTPDAVDVVEFADFECPYCRAFHATLQSAIAAYPKDKIRFVRKHAPLPSHEQALPAARADVCADEQGLGEKLAARLVEIELSPSANRRAALEVGADPEKFDRCMAGTTPDVRVNADSRLLEKAGMLGLPTTYIEGKRLLGAVSDEAVRDAIDRALRGESTKGIPAPIYVPLALLAFALVAWLGRARRGTLVHERTS